MGVRVVKGFHVKDSKLVALRCVHPVLLRRARNFRWGLDSRTPRLLAPEFRLQVFGFSIAG